MKLNLHKKHTASNTQHCFIEKRSIRILDSLFNKRGPKFQEETVKQNKSRNKRFCERIPLGIKGIQTDNGSEFEEYAYEYLQKHNLIHYWNYPRIPKSNTYYRMI
jgi:hypothetical protein